MPMRYAEMTPRELGQAWSRFPCAVAPWGALEWHGSHLPLGLDGIVAERFSESLAENLGAVLLPCCWMPVTPLPHRHSLAVRTDTFQRLIDDVLSGLYASGARTIAVVTGHYAQGHVIELYEAALRAMEDFEGLRVFAGSPLEPLGNEDLLDHAGRYETSQLLAMRPDLVRLDQFETSASASDNAVLGDAPQAASAEEGEALLTSGLERWTTWISSSSPVDLEKHYKQRFDVYQEYVDEFYEGSWESAIEAWWKTKA